MEEGAIIHLTTVFYSSV